MNDGKNDLALVIGSGSVKCAAGLGMFKTLQREGIQPDMVVGCSGGSLVAATIALGYSAEDIEALMLMNHSDQAATEPAVTS